MLDIPIKGFDVSVNKHNVDLTACATGSRAVLRSLPTR